MAGRGMGSRWGAVVLVGAACALGVGMAGVGRGLRPAEGQAAGGAEAAEWLARGDWLARRGRWEQADEGYTHAIEHWPGEARAWYGRGVARAQMGDADGAETDFGKAIDRGMAGGAAWYARALVRYRAGRFTEAEADLTEALARGMRTAAAYDARGQARAEQGRWREAGEDFRRAGERSPGDAWVGYREAMAWLAAGEETEYRRACGRLMERFGETGDEEAAGRVVRAATAGPGAVEDEAAVVRVAERTGRRHWQGAALVRAGRERQAVKRFAEGARERVPRGVDRALWALALVRLGRKEEARREWERGCQWAREQRLDWAERVETEAVLGEVGELLGSPPG